MTAIIRSKQFYERQQEKAIIAFLEGHMKLADLCAAMASPVCPSAGLQRALKTIKQMYDEGRLQIPNIRIARSVARKRHRAYNGR